MQAIDTFTLIDKNSEEFRSLSRWLDERKSMKILKQVGFILLFTFLGEAISRLIPLPIPTAIWGIILLFAALCLGIVRIEQIRECSCWLVAILPVLFVAPTVNLMDQGKALLSALPAVIVIVLASTLLTFLVAGRVTQRVRKWMEGRR